MTHQLTPVAPIPQDGAFPTINELLRRKDQPLPHLTNEEAQDKFDRSIVETYSRMELAQKGNIVFFFHLGETLHQLTDASHADIYGEHILDTFNKEFNAQGQLTLASATLKYARQFYRTMSSSAMLSCLSAGIVWNNIKQLIGKRVTEEVRDETIVKIESGEIRQAAVKQYLDEKLGNTRTRQPAKTPLQKMGEVPEAFDELMQRISSFGVNAAKLFRGGDSDYDEASTALESAETRGKKAMKLWQEQLAVARREQKKGE